MHLTIAQSQLKKILVSTKRCVGNRARLPEFGALRIAAGGNAVVIQAADGELAINVVTQAQTIDVGSVVVPAEEFKAVIDNMDGTVEISTPNEGRVLVRDDAGSFELRTIPSPDESVWHADLFKGGVPVDITAHVAQLGKVAACASKDTARPVLTGVHFRPGVVETTDSYKLAVLDVKHEFKGLVPHRLFTAVAMARPTTASIHVSEHSTVVHAETKLGSITWSARNIVGKFPNVEGLLPTTHERAFTLQRKPTERALKRLSVMRNRITAPVVADFDGVNVKLRVGSGEIGEGGLTVAAPGTASIGGPFTMAFNPVYWRQLLDAATEDVIEMQLLTELKPAMFRTAGYVGLLMPVRI